MTSPFWLDKNVSAHPEQPGGGCRVRDGGWPLADAWWPGPDHRRGRRGHTRPEEIGRRVWRYLVERHPNVPSPVSRW